MAARPNPDDGVSDTALVRELCAAVADLGAVLSCGERLWAALRLVLLTALLLSAAWLYWLLPLGWAAISAVLLAGVAYALVLIATHEMVHGTLLGWPRLEQPLACLLSWPMAWPFLTYSRLHRLHHRWNASDPRDPERTTPLPQELAAHHALADDSREAHHHRGLIGPELLGGGLKEGHQDRDQQDVVPKGGIHRRFTGTTSLGEHQLQGRPQGIGTAVLVGLGQPACVGRVRQGGRITGVGEGIAHTTQDVEGSLHWRFDQAEAMGQADPCAERSERAIGLEEGIIATSRWQQHRLQQTLQRRIHPGDAKQYGSSTTLLQHLQGNATGGVGGDGFRRSGCARLPRRRLRWQRRGGQGLCLGCELQQPGPEVGVGGGEIHGGKAQPMALDLHRFIHLGVDCWVEQQPGG
ncbi:fatty acid desaturase [Cyanobium sp. FGCU-52]|nr:fatty acid desaturase [Cyanobium sp. FGCU52]